MREKVHSSKVDMQCYRCATEQMLPMKLLTMMDMIYVEVVSFYTFSDV